MSVKRVIMKGIIYVYFMIYFKSCSWIGECCYWLSLWSSGGNEWCLNGD